MTEVLQAEVFIEWKRRIYLRQFCNPQQLSRIPTFQGSLFDPEFFREKLALVDIFADFHFSEEWGTLISQAYGLIQHFTDPNGYFSLNTGLEIGWLNGFPPILDNVDSAYATLSGGRTLEPITLTKTDGLLVELDHKPDRSFWTPAIFRHVFHFKNVRALDGTQAVFGENLVNAVQDLGDNKFRIIFANKFAFSAPVGTEFGRSLISGTYFVLVADFDSDGNPIYDPVLDENGNPTYLPDGTPIVTRRTYSAFGWQTLITAPLGIVESNLGDRVVIRTSYSTVRNTLSERSPATPFLRLRFGDSNQTHASTERYQNPGDYIGLSESLVQPATDAPAGTIVYRVTNPVWGFRHKKALNIGTDLKLISAADFSPYGVNIINFQYLPAEGDIARMYPLTSDSYLDQTPTNRWYIGKLFRFTNEEWVYAPDATDPTVAECYNYPTQQTYWHSDYLVQIQRILDLCKTNYLYQLFIPIAVDPAANPIVIDHWEFTFPEDAMYTASVDIYTKNNTTHRLSFVSNQVLSQGTKITLPPIEGFSYLGKLHWHV